MAFEEEFSVEVPDEDAEKLQTVYEVIKYIEERPNNSSPRSYFTLRKNTAYPAVFFAFQIRPGF